MKNHQHNRIVLPLCLGAALACALYFAWAKDKLPHKHIGSIDVRPSSPTALAPQDVDSDDPAVDFDSADGAGGDDPARVAAGLAFLESIRDIPGAAPLLDEVLPYLQSGQADGEALEELPIDEHAAAKLDGRYSEQLIKDPEVRAKWDQLMALVANRAMGQTARQ